MDKNNFNYINNTFLDIIKYNKEQIQKRKEYLSRLDNIIKEQKEMEEIVKSNNVILRRRLETTPKFFMGTSES